MQLDTNFKDRLKWAIEMANSNQSAVARAIGIKPQSVQAWASGATSDPSRQHLEAAAAHLGVYYDWLAWGRGPMRAGDVRPSTPSAAPSSEQVLLGREWDDRLATALRLPAPPEQTIEGHGAKVRLTWLTDEIALLKGLYLSPSSVVQAARVRLWSLTVARALAPLSLNRRWVLLLAPLGDQTVAEQHLALLQREARVMDIEVVHVSSPEQAAAVVLGRDHLTRPPTPAPDDADISDVIV